ncbi:MAG: metal-dependent hydrolase [Elusimicrobiota bacterium]
MKGLTHFISGVAAATFIPIVSRMSVSSKMDVADAASSMILVLAGMYGMLSDTLDFKLGQYLEQPDFEVDPDPRNPDPQLMADTFAAAVEKASQTGKEVKIQFFPIQLGASRWRQYCIIFGNKEVSVQINEIVSTSQVPIPGTAYTGERVGTAHFSKQLKPESSETDWLNALVRFARKCIRGENAPKTDIKPSTIDILSSTMFGLKTEKDGKIFFNWLPWHRTWSHSYVFGAFLTIPVFMISYFIGIQNWWLYGTVAFIGFATHITEDMTGHIGGSLLWPFMKERTEGLELFKASNPATNFSVIYTAFLLIIWNIDRFTTQYITGGEASALVSWQFFILFLVIPLTIYFSLLAFIRKRIRFARETDHPEDEPDGVGDAIID